MKWISCLLALLLVFNLVACQTPAEPDPTNLPGGNGASKPVTMDNAGHSHTPAEDPQTVENPYSGYCGNTMTTITLDGKEYTFEGSDSVYLTDLLLNLDYDPMRVCRCAPEFEVTTEFGGPYGVNLSQGYARCEDGQADLSVEQVEMIQKILDNHIDTQ